MCFGAYVASNEILLARPAKLSPLVDAASSIASVAGLMSIVTEPAAAMNPGSYRPSASLFRPAAGIVRTRRRAAVVNGRIGTNILGWRFGALRVPRIVGVAFLRWMWVCRVQSLGPYMRTRGCGVACALSGRPVVWVALIAGQVLRRVCGRAGLIVANTGHCRPPFPENVLAPKLLLANCD